MEWEWGKLLFKTGNGTRYLYAQGNWSDRGEWVLLCTCVRLLQESTDLCSSFQGAVGPRVNQLTIEPELRGDSQIKKSWVTGVEVGEIYSHQEQRQDAGLPSSNVIRSEWLLRHEEFKVNAVQLLCFQRKKRRKRKVSLRVNFRSCSRIIKDLADSLFYLTALLPVLCLVIWEELVFYMQWYPTKLWWSLVV